MRLADFIRRDMTEILSAWDKFARTQLPAASTMTEVHLRDHAEDILNTIIVDLQTPQSAEQQTQKSLGKAPAQEQLPETAAAMHGLLRAGSGFEITQLVGEFRALRASVLSLWARACPPGAMNGDDTTRFNEAIDQAVAESVSLFSEKMTRQRNLLLGALGHDMRSPLHVIRMSAAVLGKAPGDKKVARAAARIGRSSEELKLLLDDLVDFNRVNLGLQLTVSREPVHLALLFRNCLDQLRASDPGHRVHLNVAGNVEGTWDPHRLHQLLSNLVLNAFKYGTPGTPIRIELRGEAQVTFSVANLGPTIDPALMRQMFEPLVRGDEERGAEQGASLGLGLYICRQIARAHDGDIRVQSDAGETIFSVNLPRERTAPPAAVPA